jgi:hypothetical protein
MGNIGVGWLRVVAPAIAVCVLDVLLDSQGDEERDSYKARGDTSPVLSTCPLSQASPATALSGTLQ